jgi:hypothetical protein
MKLRDRDIAALTLPPGQAEHIFSDDDVPGFGLRLRKTGSSTAFVFQCRIGKRQRRLTLQVVPLLALCGHSINRRLQGRST